MLRQKLRKRYKNNPLKLLKLIAGIIDTMILANTILAGIMFLEDSIEGLIVVITFSIIFVIVRMNLYFKIDKEEFGI